MSTFAPKLYRGFEVLASAPFRITRNSNLYLEEEETRSLLDAVDSQVAQRRKGEAVRLEIEDGARQEIVERLVSTFELDESLVFRARGPVNLQRLFHLYEETPRPDLKYPPFVPRQVHVGVRSIVGRLLEHSRIFYFENGGKPEIHLGSADWMPRNLYERVEVLFPLKDPQLFERVSTEILSAYLADTRKARILGPDGTYSRPRAVRNGHGFSVQEHLMRLAAGVGDAHQTAVLRGPGVVYTSKGAAADPSSPEADTTAQDTSNAAV